MLIHHFLENAAGQYPDNEAVVCEDLRLDYHALHNRSVRLAVFLQSEGIKKGDVVSLLHCNCHRFVELYFACSFCGAIINSINTRLSATEVAEIMKQSETKLLFASRQFINLFQELPVAMNRIIITDYDSNILRDYSYYEDCIDRKFANNLEPVDIDEEDVAHLYFTSGTTGVPKGVMLTHKNVTIHSLNAISEFNLSEGDVWLHAAPMFHLADAWATFAITAVGGRHIISKAFMPDSVLRLIENERVTVSNMIPTMLNMLVNEETGGVDLSSFRLVLSGGAPISPKLVRTIIEKFGCDYIQTYGMTETSPYLTISRLNEHLKQLPFDQQLEYISRTGRAFLGVSLNVVREDGTEVSNDDIEIGEIIVKGDSVFKGYWKNPQETARVFKDGWFYTGDLATVNTEGYINIVDRKADVIITGGENVYSVEVEFAIYEHPAVLEAAVFGLPDEKWGEAVHAVIALKPGATATENDIKEFARNRIASFKVPKAISFIDTIPKTGSGKTSKSRLKEMYNENKPS